MKKQTNIEKIVNLICEDMEVSAPDLTNLPKDIQSQADRIPESEIEEFAIGSEDRQIEIAERYNAIELHTALNNLFS